MTCKSWSVRQCAAHLCVHQGVIEQDEPVDGKSAGILQGQSFVAALADEPAMRRLQRVLPTHDNNHHLRVRGRGWTSCTGNFTVILPGKLFQKWNVYSTSFLLLFSWTAKASNLEELSCSLWYSGDV